MRCHLYLNGEAAALWRKLPKGVRSAIVSESFLDAYRQGKLDMFLSAPESSSVSACAGEHKVEDQKTGRHNRGSGSKESCKLQQDQQGSRPVKKPGKENRSTSFRTKRDSSKPVKKPDEEPDDEKSSRRPEWVAGVYEDLEAFMHKEKK